MSDTGGRESRARDELQDLMLESLVRMSKLRHTANTVREASIDAASTEGSMTTTDRPSLGSFALDLAELGLQAWRRALEVHKDYEPELMGAVRGQGFNATLPGEALLLTEPILVFRRDEANPTGDLIGRLSVESTARTHLDVQLDRVLHLSDALDAQGARVIAPVHAEPAAVVVDPGGTVVIRVSLPRVSGLADRERWLGEFRLHADRLGHLAVPVVVDLGADPIDGDTLGSAGSRATLASLAHSGLPVCRDEEE